MSTELSRVKTYNHRKKNGKKKPPAPASEESRPVSAQPRRGRGKSGSATLSRVKAKDERNHAPKPEEETRSASFEPAGAFRSRTEKYKTGQHTSKRTGEEEDSTPSRTERYASRKIMISKYFTNSLFILFLVLTAFLVYWGVKGAPPLEELW
ncbi:MULTISPECIES: hypothetical protein [Paenibacillus]|uniref:Uncharacterized protein n=1 Tax=Paenibacillus albilobatus TaxID=2716884 RepID=A0A920CBT3_9BACL|nr:MULTISPECIES: hypothetical protein [Paenibacillus]GIO30837.1 hypothetical protein J2TS6_19780 [Paenibacillus albilobatus]